MGKQQVLILLTFIAGFVTSLLMAWGFHFYGLDSYRKSDGKILNFNPYQYEKTSKLSIQYFYTSLPRIVQIAIENRKMNFDYLTGCEGDIIPGGFAEIAVSFFQGDSPSLYIFELEGEYKVKKMHDASKLLDFKKKSPDDRFEIQCLSAAPVLNNPRFHISSEESTLANDLKLLNREIIQIKTKGSATTDLIAFDLADKKFHLVGTLSEEK